MGRRKKQPESPPPAPDPVESVKKLLVEREQLMAGLAAVEEARRGLGAQRDELEKSLAAEKREHAQTQSKLQNEVVWRNSVQRELATVRAHQKTAMDFRDPPECPACGYTGEDISPNNPRITTVFRDRLLYRACRRCQAEWFEKPKNLEA